MQGCPHDPGQLAVFHVQPRASIRGHRDIDGLGAEHLLDQGRRAALDGEGDDAAALGALVAQGDPRPRRQPLAVPERDLGVGAEVDEQRRLAALEEPELLAEDIRAFFRPLRD